MIDTANVTDGSAIKWDEIEQEVVFKLRLLKESMRAFPGESEREVFMRKQYMAGMVLPLMSLLADFCTAIKTEEEDNEH